MGGGSEAVVVPDFDGKEFVRGQLLILLRPLDYFGTTGMNPVKGRLALGLKRIDSWRFRL